MPYHKRSLKKKSKSTKRQASKAHSRKHGKKDRKRTMRKQKGGSDMLFSPTALVGYPMDGGQPGSWPGAASAALWENVPRLDTHGMTMSNHWGLSPNGVPAGGLDLPVPSNAINKQCGGGRKTQKKTMRGRRFHQAGGFSPEELISGPFSFLKGMAENAMSAIKGTPPYPSSSPLDQPIGKDVKFASMNVVDVPKAMNESAAEVVALEPSNAHETTQPVSA